METNPNFNTNAPLFEVRTCKVILGVQLITADNWGDDKTLLYHICNLLVI